MRRAAAFGLLVLAFGLASWLGWWAVPAVAALWGLLRPAVPRPAQRAAVAATLGWVAWLFLALARDPAAVARLTDRAAAVLQIPPLVLLLLTLAFPALLGWSAAALGYELAGRWQGARTPRAGGPAG